MAASTQIATMFQKLMDTVRSEAANAGASKSRTIGFRKDDGNLTVLKIMSTPAGAVVCSDASGNISLDQFKQAYIDSVGDRLQAVETAQAGLYYANENIGNLRDALGSTST